LAGRAGGDRLPAAAVTSFLAAVRGFAVSALH
jgi:hypothetical protein